MFWFAKTKANLREIFVIRISNQMEESCLLGNLAKCVVSTSRRILAFCFALCVIDGAASPNRDELNSAYLSSQWIVGVDLECVRKSAVSPQGFELCLTLSSLPPNRTQIHYIFTHRPTYLLVVSSPNNNTKRRNFLTLSFRWCFSPV